DFFFFFNDTATTEIYTLSLHDALPISHSEEHQVRVEGEFRAGDGLKPGHRADARGVELFDVAMFIAGEPGGGDAPFADAALFVRAFGAELHGPEGPGGGRGALERGLRQQLELMHGEGLLAVGGAQT